ncbi:unnamed protein product [Heligmosomoides polygyrus]|uniref:SHSP domain-containing protein n=1 Tax=Heligmosomoides polygyrus TaxID=6339 RepID=A0A183FGN1_HELPZ|nr:unnamed protein product [Heligmosomoides polygyrus]
MEDGILKIHIKNAKGFLDPRETFEHYENRSRPASSQSFEQPGAGGAPHGRLACEYRQAPPTHSAVP